MSASAVESRPEVLDVLRIGASTPPNLVIEVPHGATEERDFTALAAALDGPHPDGLVEFFHVNTDAGAPELAVAVAEALVSAGRSASVLVLRCRIPRTFIDCNRQLPGGGAAGPTFTAPGEVTPGMMPWVRSEADRALLLGRYREYQAVVEAAADAFLPRALLLQLHTYAPRTVDVAVDEDIMTSLRAAYAPGRAETWPLRPALDLIHRVPEGASLAPASLHAALERAFEGIEVVGDGETYPLHPATRAHFFSVRFPNRVVCLEVRRDRLTERFEPLRPVQISPAHVSRVAGPLAMALGETLESEPSGLR